MSSTLRISIASLLLCIGTAIASEWANYPYQQPYGQNNYGIYKKLGSQYTIPSYVADYPITGASPVGGYGYGILSLLMTGIQWAINQSGSFGMIGHILDKFPYSVMFRIALFPVAALVYILQWLISIVSSIFKFFPRVFTEMLPYPIKQLMHA